MRLFFSPAERRILDSLPPAEALIVRTLMRELDATLVEEDQPPVEQPSLFDVAA